MKVTASPPVKTSDCVCVMIDGAAVTALLLGTRWIVVPTVVVAGSPALPVPVPLLVPEPELVEVGRWAVAR